MSKVSFYNSSNPPPNPAKNKGDIALFTVFVSLNSGCVFQFIAQLPNDDPDAEAFNNNDTSIKWDFVKKAVAMHNGCMYGYYMPSLSTCYPIARVDGSPSSYELTIWYNDGSANYKTIKANSSNLYDVSVQSIVINYN